MYSYEKKCNICVLGYVLSSRSSSLHTVPGSRSKIMLKLLVWIFILSFWILAPPKPPPGCVGWSWGRCDCHKDPCQTEFQFCWVPHMGGIKLQLLCGVRIELAVGSLPYPRFSLDSNCLVEGVKSGLQLPPWTWQNPSRGTHFPSYGRRPPKPTYQPNQTRGLHNGW